MTPNIMRWLAVGLLWLVLWPAQAPAQQESWETYMRAGGAVYRRSNYTEAEKQWKAGLDAAEAFGTQDPRFAISLNNLALLYDAQGRYAEAEPLYKRALAVDAKGAGTGPSRLGHGPQQPRRAVPSPGQVRRGRAVLQTLPRDHGDGVRAFREKRKPVYQGH